MDKATIAILVSVASAMIAGASLAWTVYRDFKFRARVKFYANKIRIYSIDVPPSEPLVSMRATNHGPGPVTLNSVVLKNSTLWKRLRRNVQHAMLNYDYANPLSATLPKRIDVGESINVFVPFDGECFLRDEFTDIGITDSFDRTHWAPHGAVKKMRDVWLDEFDSEANAKDE